MARERARFKAADLTRALKGACAAGFTPKHVQIAPDGTISLCSESPDQVASDQVPEANNEPNPWDEAAG
ncbi:MAG: hypothetical protein B7X76_08360 [Azorhizobium sp. 39-67-5]|nr:MAG: hypothetical protein B7X76_08360 [Azorhizobium sp. 39-67-5]